MTEIERLQADVEALKVVLMAFIQSLPPPAQQTVQANVGLLRDTVADLWLATTFSDEQRAHMANVAYRVSTGRAPLPDDPPPMD